MKRLVPLMKFSAAVAAMFVAVSCQAQVTETIWIGIGSQGKWENEANWSDGLPTDPNTARDDRGPIVIIDRNADVLFDAATWQSILDANQLNTMDGGGIGNTNGFALQHWGMGQLLMGTDTVNTGTQTFTFDHGGTNFVNIPNTQISNIGAAAGSTSTLNVLSGTLELGGNPVRLGTDAGSSGTVNVSGGAFVLTRANFQIGSQAGGGVGTFNISGGEFRNRTDVTLGASGTFNVVGSAATEIGIGSRANGDGAWTQVPGGTLRVGLDSGGITPILIDDTNDDGGGTQGNVTFEAGAILDPYDAGGANDAWTTVMTWEGTLTGLPTLNPNATPAGWEMRVEGNNLQVRNLNLTGGVQGDFTGDGVVDCDDLDGYVGNIDDPATGTLAALDLDGDGVLSAADANTHITTLVVTSNGGTGTVPGDLNCDGEVDVLDDAFILVANLNAPVASYSLGDANFDGVVDVLGDAFILVANLGFPNN